MATQPVALQVRTPEPISPLQTVGSLMQLRQGQSEIALRQAQMLQAQQQSENIRAQADQRNRDLADENTVQAAQNDPSLAASLGKGDFSTLAGKVQPKTLQTLSTNYQDLVSKRATASTAQLTLDDERHTKLEKALSGLKDLAGKNFADAQAAYPAALADLQAQGVLNPGTFPPALSSPEQIDQLAAKNNVFHGLTKAALETKKEQSGITKTEAETAKTDAERANLEAELPGKKAGAAAIVAQLPVTQAIAADTLANANHLSPAEQEKANEAAATNKTAAARAAAESLKASIDAKKFEVEFGGDAVKGWAKVLAENPDAAGTVPAALRTAVGQEFTKQTGLPYPKPLSGTAVDQERAARNALSAMQQINRDLKDPEIQSRLGPILGRLGNVEQAVGTAVDLTPEQEAKAQRLRTNMRYLVFQEGKALLGGRLPQNLMKQLEESSPNVALDPGTLSGSLAGVQDAAVRSLRTADQQRFGGKSRTDAALGIANPAGHAVGDILKVGGKLVKITAIHPDGTYDGDEVKK